MAIAITYDDIKNAVNDMKEHLEEWGFEGYIVLKTEPRLRKMSFDEKRYDQNLNYKETVKNLIAEAVIEKYLGEEKEYVDGTYVADNQNKFYIISESENYNPFAYLNETHRPAFKFEDIGNATGMFFSFRYNNEIVWVYQHLWSMMIPNKKKTGAMAKFLRFENEDIFAEQKEPLITISKKVDLLVLGENIVTDNISLMQSSFGFQDFIQEKAKESIEKIVDNGIIEDRQKLEDYIARRKNSYARRLMRITNSKVFALSKEQLIEKIHTVPRWNGKFEFDGEKIVLNTYKQVENLIDLFDERYTKSEITEQEYDTDVKKLAEPVSNL